MASPAKISIKDQQLHRGQGQHDSQLFNLDNDGTSQFTYPAGQQQQHSPSKPQPQFTQYNNSNPSASNYYQQQAESEADFQYDQTGM